MPENEKEIAKKVEESFVKEDAETPPHSSFARPEDDTGQKKQVKKPSPTEIGLYNAYRLKNIDEKLGVIVNLLMADPKKVEEVAKAVQPKKEVQKTQPTLSSKDSKEMERLKLMFPEDLESMLRFEEKDTYFKISPRQFLGSDNFSKIASIIREAGGAYISDGKKSHFTLATSKLGTGQPVEEKEKAQPPKPKTRLEEISLNLKEFLDKDLIAINTEASATMFVVEFKQYLGSENFAKIGKVAREMGGTYVSQGKASHFDIPKQNPKA